ncbi:MAG: alanine--tRNA ligase [Desulfurococcales archaeon]|nr:alanine--tRNA ligase [Desulfurococcales archaeon]
MPLREEPEFKNEFLLQNNYKPYKCKRCGERFWSLIPKTTCPDRPCSKYDFLIKKYPKVPRLSFDEARRKFIEFFQKHGHGYVDPYPVLARWRNDLYLTIASIIVFQPAVTEGIVDPPYNPLVIVQPCIRLEDIDNIGLTFGRHLTSFEMAAHHAFNRKEKPIYWVSKTLEYAFKFFTEEIGIPAKDIAFKDSWWEGGGNAGPSFEVLVDGLELATLVFMKYKVVNGEYKPNPLTIVDTGYGVERIAWFTQKTPTAFHAIYGSLVNKYKDILSIEEPPEDVLRDIVYQTSNIDIKSLAELKKSLVKIGYKEYINAIEKSIYMYTLLDHIKTLELMLSDGIVPSNTGEGYLARLVLRRALRTLRNLSYSPHEFNEIILALADEQIKYWKGRYVYDKFSKFRDYIIDVIAFETNKYRETLNKGLRIVERMVKRKKNIQLDDLIEIYDSHGIPPEIVAQKAKEYNISISVPPDFYSIIAHKHGGPAKLEKAKEEEIPSEIAEWLSSFPETKRLFHEDPYQISFSAKVLGVKKEFIVLDQTIFYPKAGGQDFDVGYIVFPNNTRIKVKGVYKKDNVIVHELETDVSRIVKPGDIVSGYIDWPRRYRLMRHHTATHVILGAARRVLGEHVWQAGAEKTLEKARLDITHYKMLTPDEVMKIERLANTIVDERKQLVFHMLGKFEAEKKYGLKIYQGGAIISKHLRIVEIPGWDAEACFGTHLYNTGEIGGIKIINVDKIQDGVIRLEFIAGTRVPEYSSMLEGVIDQVAKTLNISRHQVIEGVKRLYDSYNDLRKLLNKYRSKHQDLLYSSVIGSAMNICGLKVVIIRNELGDEVIYRDLIKRLSEEGFLAIYDSIDYVELAMNPELARKLSIDLRNVIKDLRRSYPGIKGGGKPDHITLKIRLTKDVLEKIINSIKEMLGCERN